MDIFEIIAGIVVLIIAVVLLVFRWYRREVEWQTEIRSSNDESETSDHPSYRASLVNRDKEQQ